ncbi:MAG TPA: hypothetical protein VFE02_20345 [Candidatus Acidoferrales bacterium]|nr:hypothetical protein [Candidatus Acidoferrales bacterium]
MKNAGTLKRLSFATALWLLIPVTSLLIAQTCEYGPCNSLASGKTVYLNGSRLPTIQSCIDSAGAGGTCVVPSSYSGALPFSSRLTINTSGTTLRCEPGAIIQQAGGFRSAHLMVITGNDVTVTGCTIRGDHSASNSALIFASGVTGLRISKNKLENVASENFAVYIGGATSDFEVEKNDMTIRMAGRPIYVISNLPNTSVKTGTIRNNRIATLGGTSEDDVMLLTNVSTAGLSNVTVSNNVMSNGPASCAKGGCFCVEVGGFGGPGPTDITVKDNVCTARAAVNGGYSMAGTPPLRYKVNNNQYDAKNQKTVIAAYELSGSAAIASRNLARNLTGPGYCISVNMLSSSTVTENDCDGFSNGTNGAGIMIYGGALGRAGNNTISSNRVIFPAPSNHPHYGIWLQCNHTLADCSGNKIIGNRIEGNGGAETYGIKLEKDYGTMIGTSVTDNEILNTNVGLYISVGVLSTKYFSGMNRAATPLVNRGEATIWK